VRVAEGANVRTIAGRYELDELLGQGAFGQVWRARDRRFRQRHVAVKVLKPEHLRSARTVAYFWRECEALAALQHPNVVAASDRGPERIDDLADALARGEAPDVFLVMEYIPGGNLSRWLARHRTEGNTTDPAAVGRLFAQVCAGVAAAHALAPPAGPVIHRDLKCDNVLVFDAGDGPVARITDFGIARLGERPDTASVNAVLGTLTYMSPEQLAGDAARVGTWSDVFSLGVMLVEMLTFARNWRGTLWSLTPAAERSGVHVALIEARSDVHDAVWTVALRCLDPDPAKRFRDAGELRRALPVEWRAPGVAATLRTDTNVTARIEQSTLSQVTGSHTVSERVRASTGARVAVAGALLVAASLALALGVRRRASRDVKRVQAALVSVRPVIADAGAVLAVRCPTPDRAARIRETEARERTTPAPGAEEDYRAACECGDRVACGRWGELAFKREANGTRERARPLLQRGCDANDPRACAYLGTFAFPERTPEGDARAARYFGVGCDGGVLEGCLGLDALWTRQGDARRAGEARRRACSLGHAASCQGSRRR
jgi:serine/threonine-protein kinase